MAYIAKGISKKQARALASFLRNVTGQKNKRRFPIVEFLENVMPKVFPDFNYEIVDDGELPGMEGLTIPSENLIKIPNRVYNAAVNGDGRARFSIAHEIGHYLLHDQNSIALARTGRKVRPFEDPEWQANTFASELLIAPNLSIGMSVDEIAEAFGVSRSAARVHLSKKKEDGLP